MSPGRVVLVVGSGGREHALSKRLARSPSVGKVLVAPGNPGTEEVGQNIALPADGPTGDNLAKICEREAVDLVVVGPEDPLVAGVADVLRSRGVAVFGPSKEAARLEGSKAFMKRFAVEHRVPTSPFEVFDDPGRASQYIRTRARPPVIKADGLCAGKGVVVAADFDEAERSARAMLSGEAFGAAGRTIVVEDRLDGAEASVHAICDGTKYLLLPVTQDHKRIGEGDRGPNTGGMGAYGPTPLVTPELERRIAAEIIEPVLKGMVARGTPYSGALYAGLMITPDGEPKVIEFNVRFGDPETEVLVDLVDGDFGELLAGVATSRLDSVAVKVLPRHAIAVVLASEGYPGKPRTGDVIEGLDDAARVPRVNVLHAGTRREGGRLVTAGGRVLIVTATGATLREARDTAYEGVGRVRFRGMQVRRDIAWRALS
jgi:phosphoribosylamine--glycine ligase